MAAALREQSLRNRGTHRGADIDTGDRASGTRADAVCVERDRKSRLARGLLQTRCNKADHAGMRGFTRRDHNIRVRTRRSFRIGKGCALDLLTLGIQTVEFLRDALPFYLVVACQK